MNAFFPQKKYALLLMAAMTSVMAFADGISGVVKDAAGEAIIGASVQVKGS